MAYEIKGQVFGNEVAAGDLSAKKYYLVEMTSTGINLCGDGEECLGVLQATAASGDICEVMVTGISKASAGTSLTKGLLVASDTNGQVVAAASGDHILGWTLDAVSNAGELVTVLIDKQGRNA